MRSHRARALAALGGALLLATGCGVPLETAAKPLPSGALPPPTTRAPEPSPSPTPTLTTPSPTPTPDTARLWFVQDEGVVSVIAPVAGEEPQQLLDALATPPAQSPEVRTVVIDPLTGEPFVRVVPTEPPQTGIVTVAASAEFTALPPGEQVLLLGQVVLTLTGVRTPTGVAVVSEQGEPLAVPLPDGRLLDGPATAADYRALVRRG